MLFSYQICGVIAQWIYTLHMKLGEKSIDYEIGDNNRITLLLVSEAGGGGQGRSRLMNELGKKRKEKKALRQKKMKKKYRS